MRPRRRPRGSRNTMPSGRGSVACPVPVEVVAAQIHGPRRTFFHDPGRAHCRGSQRAKLTRRQAGFLAMVMVHSGVCVRRQYCAYAHMRHGQRVVDFFSFLFTRRAATRYTEADGRARIFHVHVRALYGAIDEPHNCNRKPITLGRAFERLMLLDAVLAQPELRWLGTEWEKVEYLRRRTRLREDEMPLLRFGAAPKETVRYFPDKLPIGVAADERSHLFPTWLLATIRWTFGRKRMPPAIAEPDVGFTATASGPCIGNGRRAETRSCTQRRLESSTTY